MPSSPRVSALVIYFIQVGHDGPIKIGKAVDPEKRLQTLQTGTPETLRLLAVIPGDRTREAEIHRHLKAHRQRGEWFAANAEVLGYVAGLRDIEYTRIDGRSYAVLRRERAGSPTSFCPFCGDRHRHGIGDGHRGAHCWRVIWPEVQTPDGTILRQSDGYIIASRNG